MEINKKGNASIDLLLILIIIVGLGLAFPIIYSNLSPVLESLSASSSFGPEAQSVLNDFNDRFPQMLDNMFLIVFVLFWAGAVALSYFSDTHPIFLVISWLLVIVILFCAVFLGNFVEQFINQDGLSLAKSDLPKIVFISSHILEFMIAIAFTMLLALYGKTRSRGGGI